MTVRVGPPTASGRRPATNKRRRIACGASVRRPAHPIHAARYCGRSLASRGAKLQRCRLAALRHTFATRLVRGGTDLVVVAELLGHSRLETTRVYTRPTREDAIKALELLDTDS